MKAKLTDLPTQDYVHINTQIAMWLKENFDTMKSMSRKEAVRYAVNIQYYLGCCPLECQGEFFNLFGKAKNDGEDWPLFITELNPSIADAFIEVYQKIKKS